MVTMEEIEMNKISETKHRPGRRLALASFLFLLDWLF
jgi:hypothetical protein